MSCDIHTDLSLLTLLRELAATRRELVADLVAETGLDGVDLDAAEAIAVTSALVEADA